MDAEDLDSDAKDLVLVMVVTQDADSDLGLGRGGLDYNTELNAQLFSFKLNNCISSRTTFLVVK